MEEYVKTNKTKESEKSITTTIETDILRNKMDKHVIKYIDKFIAPEFRTNQDAIRLASECRKASVALYQINNRFEVMEEEFTEKEQGEELARLEKVMQEEVRRDGLNSIKEDDYRLIEHHDWDELYTWGQEGTDTNYLHY